LMPTLSEASCLSKLSARWRGTAKFCGLAPTRVILPFSLQFTRSPSFI
jgi:hypothetical protein